MIVIITVIDFTTPGDRNVIKKEARKILTYKERSTIDINVCGIKN
jgi:hypothetical protein